MAADGDATYPAEAAAAPTTGYQRQLVTTTGLQSVGGIEDCWPSPASPKTPAGQNRRVLAYEDQFLLGGGPRIGQTLTQLVGDLHRGARAPRSRSLRSCVTDHDTPERR